jgi:hypothetical protein
VEPLLEELFVGTGLCPYCILSILNLLVPEVARNNRE